MATHKERIESLEEGLNHLYQAESDRDARLSKLEENVARITELLEKWHGKQKIDEERYQQRSVESNEGREGRMILSSKSAKLEFPRFAGEEPTEWRNRVEQYFEFQNTPDDQKILLASYHLEGEANKWWQSIRRAYREEGKELQWLHFKEEKWAMKLSCYDFEILYRPGKENKAADALSRRENDIELNTIYHAQATIWDELREVSENDEYVRQIRSKLETQDCNNYLWKNGLLWYKGQAFVPDARDLMSRILYEMHDTRIGGHSGILRTGKRLKQQFYWPQMSTSQGKDTIFVVVDRLTKGAHFMSLTHPFTAKMVADKFIDGVFKLHGFPTSIISDRDLLFMSHFWREFFARSGTKLKHSSAYHPQTDGQSEVTNRCLEQYLRCFVNQWPKRWNEYLPWAEYWFNTTYHHSTRTTPFEATYGRLPPILSIYHGSTTKVSEVDKQVKDRNEIIHQLKKNLEVSRNRVKQSSDAKRRNVSFVVGDYVLLRLHPYRHISVFKRVQKLSHSYFGPYRIIQHFGETAYKLELPCTSRIHPTFHASLLKKYVTPTNAATIIATPLPEVSDEGILELTLEDVLQKRWIKNGNKLQEESLVKWRHLAEEDVTWESSDQLKQGFPDVILGDKNRAAEGAMIDQEGRVDRLSQTRNTWSDV